MTFCVECGATVRTVQGLCPDCFMERHVLISPPENIDVVRCSQCSKIQIGKTWVETEDPFPLSSADNSRWGFRSILGGVWIDNLRVFQQLLPERVDVTAMADVYIQTRQPESALRHLLQVAGSYDDPAMLLRVIKKIMAIDETWPQAGAFEALLSRKDACLKAVRTMDEAVARRFLQALMSRFASDRARAGEIRPLLDVFAEKLGKEPRFSFYVFMGLAFSQAGNPSAAGDYFRRADRKSVV